MSGPPRSIYLFGKRATGCLKLRSVIIIGPFISSFAARIPEHHVVNPVKISLGEFGRSGKNLFHIQPN
jgi:hypothetical protein